MPLKLITIVGARPQFIKAAAVSGAIKRLYTKFPIDETILHTGQHYDDLMSDVFFRDLNIPQPTVNLGIGSFPHGEQVGKMLIALEPVLQEQKPDMVLVYGDTNSTLAGALVATKLGIPVTHVEAGLRLYTREVPEETNRVLTDHMSSILFCSSRVGVENLHREGIDKQVFISGDVMLDVLNQYRASAFTRSSKLTSDLNVYEYGYYLATIHRPDNTDDLAHLKRIIDVLDSLDMPVIMPMHPRTRARLGNYLCVGNILRVIEPVSYLDMLALEATAKIIITDSGGMQKEAFWLNVPCVLVQCWSEWTELVNIGAVVLSGQCPTDILPAIAMIQQYPPEHKNYYPYGCGYAAENIVRILGE